MKQDYSTDDNGGYSSK